MTTLLRNRFVQFTALILALLGTTLEAQDAKNQCTMKAGEKQSVFKKLAAIRAKSDDENRIVVLAASQPITPEVVKSVKGSDAEGNLDNSLDMDYLKAVFSEDGKLTRLIGDANNSSFMTSGGDAKVAVTVADGRIKGTLTLVTEGNFGKDIALNFDLQIDAEIKAADPTKLDPPVKPEVTGNFLGNGKAAELKFVSVGEHEDFNDKPAITLVFTEKDHSAAKKPSFDAAFGKFGSALILSVHHNGKIFGCEVRHSGLKKGTFSSLGQIQMSEFEMVGGNVTGHVVTDGTLDFFGDKWAVDLKFAAPLPDKLRNPSAAKDKPVEKAAEKPVAKVPMEEKEEKPAAGPRISARKLPLPTDAADVDFKALVEQIHCTSKLSVEAVTKDLSARLKAAGWKDGKGGLATKKSAILKREQGAAKLTIMIQPSGTGSTVKIFGEGLDWEGGDDAKSPAIKEVEDELNDAKKLLKDSLKGIPKGF